MVNLGSIGDVSKLGSVGGDISKLGSVGGDISKLGGIGGDISKLGGIGGDISKLGGIGEVSKLGKIGNIGGFDLIDISKAGRRFSDASTLVSSPVLKTVTKELADEGIQLSQKTIKSLDDIGSSSNTSRKIAGNATQSELKEVNTFWGRTKNSFKDITWSGVKNNINNNWRTYGLILGASTMTIIAITAKAKTDKINGTGYTITSIKKDPRNSKIVNITYEPKDVFTPNDTITITGSNSAPTIDNIYRGAVLNPSAGAFSLKLQNPITMDGTSGTFTVITEFSNQFANEVSDVTQPIVEAGGEVVAGATSAAVGTAGNIVSDTAEKIFPGINDFFSQFGWIISILCALLLIMSSFSALFVVLKK